MTMVKGNTQLYYSLANISIDIKWDTDNEVVDLPSQVEIPQDIAEDDVADYLADLYGFCVFSYSVK